MNPAHGCGHIEGCDFSLVDATNAPEAGSATSCCLHPWQPRRRHPTPGSELPSWSRKATEQTRLPCVVHVGCLMLC